LAPPGRLLPPLRLLSWAIFGTILGHIWDKKRSGEDFIWLILGQGSKTLILGQKHSVSGEDLFFLEIAEFWAKNTPQIRWWPFFFFFFRDRWILGQKHTPNPVMTFFFSF